MGSTIHKIGSWTKVGFVRISVPSSAKTLLSGQSSNNLFVIQSLAALSALVTKSKADFLSIWIGFLARSKINFPASLDTWRQISSKLEFILSKQLLLLNL